ncbi:MAG: Rne/Rng family ribonuclease [Zymomonas mobilis subsp. pomaceae]|uniref:Ribonuclease E n=1 Tax=Zymomonas mobilis subsp. pomaceae (strain ATCC 29192 / DSM 22645 / JCM 10191 / CCUG 17912 / NBRC 13757 / NCIMB 11200 / NRRL B-4491 / Barker I) TaxID=579138 RepID=F8ESX1_ZYMMT|nr:ribonuclease E/G [Zymomonas mobilis]AEI37875.1 ribonuclease, Rne/Rng family [Zymomonas mobilis subsp. pomaceae ATCC 29192]MDX5949241.1 Rne/Rng family ribonuclease [Zymomonas mobilis subsp. pomaceae]GEB89529.1 ribonuclease E [Zymomonas mobilis subsp. pomaceae]
MTLTKMLIDARHREETRVAVIKGNRIEEFDFESAGRRQLKGNIYLAKVTRVEPSLQAAFVDYGGNRQGFLAFSEIHPDYYQIPREDREALLREEEEYSARQNRQQETEDDEDTYESADSEPSRNDTSEDSFENLRNRRRHFGRHHYRIQDVIRRRQVLLVQVVKEERGNKGAALTTYLSLAGRYCVLMPNTSNGGGISRKISNLTDRKRLKAIMAELNLPSSMGCIVRTAGLQRTKSEIKRDFDYLARLWDEIREKTLYSQAPALIYGDSDLIKRAIRDIYSREVDEILVEGSEGYQAARNFMRLLMPSHVRKVRPYADPAPLFQRFGVEQQLNAMYQPIVQLKSGGYLVINPTEALVSIDINSGRSTREHNIEQTATATNLEAATEIARQLRLRDMAGLIVIDFIDMESSANVRRVEKAMKDALKHDRARIQIGHISSFGLFEMSRQRLRTGMLEASTIPCPHCQGSGLMLTTPSSGLMALRMIEDEASRGNGSQIHVMMSLDSAIYVLNRKRKELGTIETLYGVTVLIDGDPLRGNNQISVESAGPPPSHGLMLPPPLPTLSSDDSDEYEEEIEEEIEEIEEIEAEEIIEAPFRKNHRQNMARREYARSEPPFKAENIEEEPEEFTSSVPETEEETGYDDDSEHNRRNRRSRRGRRGGRRRNGEAIEKTAEFISETTEAEPIDLAPDYDLPKENHQPNLEPEVEVPTQQTSDVLEEEATEAPVARSKTRRRPRARPVKAEKAEEETTGASEMDEKGTSEARIATPKATDDKTSTAESKTEEEDKAEEVKPKRVRKRTTTSRRKKAEPKKVDVSVEEKEEVKSDATEKASEKTTSPEVEKPIETVKKEKPAEEVSKEATPSEEPKTASDKKAEETTPTSSDEGEKPAPRRGWWQRTFGE